MGEVVKRLGTYRIVLAALWPKIYVLQCCYCAGKAARGGIDIDGEYAHKACHTEASR